MLFFPPADLSRVRADAPIRKDLLGECDKKTTFEILDFFYEQGGNFIDTYVSLIGRLQQFVERERTNGSIPPERTTTKPKSPRPGSASGCKPVESAIR
jgi:hypothetical protein